MQRVKILMTALLAGAALVFSACEPQERQSYDIEPTEVSPSVNGELSVEEFDESNYQVELDLQFLALPSSLGQELSTYAVWIRPRDSSQYLKMGHLNFDREERTGTIKFTTPYDQFTVGVTAEENTAVEDPGDTLILQQPVRVE